MYFTIVDCDMKQIHTDYADNYGIAVYKAIIAGISLDNAYFVGQDLTRANFSACLTNIINADFSGAQISIDDLGPKLALSNLVGAIVVDGDNKTVITEQPKFLYLNGYYGVIFGSLLKIAGNANGALYCGTVSDWDNLGDHMWLNGYRSEFRRNRDEIVKLVK